jgi:regulator of nucleoside diphosphate kinase
MMQFEPDHDHRMTSDARRDVIRMVRADHDRLRALVEGMAPRDPALQAARARLEAELDRADVVEADEVPLDVITLDSWARLLDLDSDRELLISPVLPSRANADSGRISVLAPLGMAVLGYRAGDVIEWPTPGGRRRLEVVQVMFQPEAHARQGKSERPRRGRTSRRPAGP